MLLLHMMLSKVGGRVTVVGDVEVDLGRKHGIRLKYLIVGGVFRVMKFNRLVCIVDEGYQILAHD